MKNFRIFILLLTIIGFASCNDDYLDLYPQDKFTKNHYWKTTNDLELYCNQYYSATTFDVHKGWSPTFYLEDNSDNLVPAIPNVRLSGALTLPNTSADWSWHSIRIVNYFLSNYHTVEGVKADIDNFVGETYFFKAFYYFKLLKKFGDLPWYDKVLGPDDSDLYKARAARNVVADSIVSTLDKAINMLKSKEAAGSFRVNREIAMLMKSRVCLYEGTWEKYHNGTDFGVEGQDGTKFLHLAKEISEKLIDENKYSIYSAGDPNSSYWSLFNQNDYTNNSEVMMWRKYDIALGLTHNLQKDLPWRGRGSGVSLSFMESYLNKDGSLSESVDYSTLASMATGRDPRLAQTVLLPGDILTNKGYENPAIRVFTTPLLDKASQDRNTTGFMLYKGLDPNPAQQKNQEGISITASIIFRYAEVLLNYAEACAELGELDQVAVDKSINKLRNRVDMALFTVGNLPSDPKNILGVSDVIWEVRRERRIELGFENFRFDDLMRWRAHKLFITNMPKGMKFYGSDLGNSYTDFYPAADINGFLEPYQSSLPQGYGFNPNRDYLLPIPSKELNLNNNLVSNPGW